MSQSQQRRRSTYTQWTAQFLAAAELCRRGYVVTFTMGNCTPDYDLMIAPQGGGEPFYIDVKGLSSNSDWLISKKNKLSNLYYILIKIDAKDRNEDIFFIMSQDEVNNELDVYQSTPKKDGTERSKLAQGFSFVQAVKYKDKWDKFPQHIKESTI